MRVPATLGIMTGTQWLWLGIFVACLLAAGAAWYAGGEYNGVTKAALPFGTVLAVAFIPQARLRGITWARVGSTLGMTRQFAWDRFTGVE